MPTTAQSSSTNPGNTVRPPSTASASKKNEALNVAKGLLAIVQNDMEASKGDRELKDGLRRAKATKVSSTPKSTSEWKQPIRLEMRAHLKSINELLVP